MVVFLVLCALIAVVLYRQIITAFFANPGLNALIGLVLNDAFGWWWCDRAVALLIAKALRSRVAPLAVCRHGVADEERARRRKVVRLRVRFAKSTLTC